MQKILELLGWVGVVCVIGAFVLLTTGQIDSSSFAWHAANLLGALFLIGSSAVKRDWQPIALNSIWAVIALYGLLLT